MLSFEVLFLFGAVPLLSGDRNVATLLQLGVATTSIALIAKRDPVEAGAARCCSLSQEASGRRRGVTQARYITLSKEKGHSMTITPAAPLGTATCLAAGKAHRNKRGATLWHGALRLGATVLHYAGHHGGQIFGCLVPMLHLPALDVGAAVLLFAGSIYVSRRPREA